MLLRICNSAQFPSSFFASPADLIQRAQTYIIHLLGIHSTKMKASFLTSLLLASLVAADVPGPVDRQSGPFNLIVQSQDKRLDGRAFTACHEGAAVESICLLDKSFGKAVFNFNFTTAISDPTFGPPGVLTWDLQARMPTPSLLISCGFCIV